MFVDPQEWIASGLENLKGNEVNGTRRGQTMRWYASQLGCYLSLRLLYNPIEGRGAPPDVGPAAGIEDTTASSSWK